MAKKKEHRWDESDTAVAVCWRVCVLCMCVFFFILLMSHEQAETPSMSSVPRLWEGLTSGHCRAFTASFALELADIAPDDAALAVIQRRSWLQCGYACS